MAQEHDENCLKIDLLQVMGSVRGVFRKNFRGGLRKILKKSAWSPKVFFFKNFPAFGRKKWNIRVLPVVFFFFSVVRGFRGGLKPGLPPP